MNAVENLRDTPAGQAALYVRDYHVSLTEAAEAHDISRRSVTRAWDAMFPGVPRPPAPKREHAPYRCRSCGEHGHNSATCKKRRGAR